MRGTHAPQQTNLHTPHATRKRHVGTVHPILTANRERRSRRPIQQIRRRENLDSVLLRPGVRIALVVSGGIGAGYHDAPVEEDNRFGVVETCDGRVGHDAEALVYGFGRIVEESVVIWGTAEAEACYAVLAAACDKVGAVWEAGHAGHYSSGWLCLC